MGFFSKLFEPPREAQPLPPSEQGANSHLSEAERTLESLKSLLSTAVSNINASGDRLPPIGSVLARRITDGLAAILKTASAKSLDVYSLMNVENILKDYLPTTLNTYVAAGRSDEDTVAKLVEQLKLLHHSVVETLVALKANDAQALEQQRRFIETKFTGSDLE